MPDFTPVAVGIDAGGTTTHVRAEAVVGPGPGPPPINAGAGTASAACAVADRPTGAFGVPEVPAPGAASEGAADVSAEWGRHAPSVFAAAGEGSSLARAVIAEGGLAPARLVVPLAGRGVRVDDVVVAGGAVLGRPVLYEAFTTALAEALPSARPRQLRVPPVERARGTGPGAARRRHGTAGRAGLAVTGETGMTGPACVQPAFTAPGGSVGAAAQFPAPLKGGAVPRPDVFGGQ
ncbi:hypothetical protein [Streptomyces tauricus]|uniref:hypothetical protein n=1 Tax=Streptomyces tauricus TaxID=68274 RepID=UPI003F4E1AC2